MSISLIQKPGWMLLLCLTMASAHVFGVDDQSDSIQTDPQILAPVLPPKLISPELESVERPSGQYKLDDIITYQVKVKWPEHSSEIRMSSPRMDLENLELIGVSEETVSGPGRDADSELEQILILRFQAQKEGPAKINSLILEWTQAGGTLASSLKIPSVELMIQKRKNPVIWISVFGFLCIVLVVSLFFIRRKNKKAMPVSQSQTIEEQYLSQLGHIKNSPDKDWSGKEMLVHLDAVLEQYIRQKFNWIRGQEDYNALQNKIDKKEISQIKEFFDKMEYLRFSSSELKREEFISLFEKVQMFIERRKVIQTQEEAWKQQ